MSNTIDNVTRTLKTALAPKDAARPADDGAAPMSAPPAEKAGIFESKKRGGDSRLISPGGGGFGALSNAEAIDGNTTKSGDFTEARTVGGMTLFYTAEGAKAVDEWTRRAADSSAPLHAEKDPGFWERFFEGDLFAGKEQFTGKTK